MLKSYFAWGAPTALPRLCKKHKKSGVFRNNSGRITVYPVLLFGIV